MIAPHRIGPRRGGPDRRPRYLDGQLLVAMPSMSDPRFARRLVYLCAHSADGAMGLIVNQIASHISFPDLLRQLDVAEDEQAIRLPASVEQMPVHVGGPVETGRGFVLHSPDVRLENSLVIDGRVCLTATLDILRAIVKGDGPRHAMLALGYAGWAPGQLESEIQANGWLNCEPDDGLLFGADQEGKYLAALKKIGIDPAFLASEAGNA